MNPPAHGDQGDSGEHLDPMALVRRGYDAASCAYRADDHDDALYRTWAERLDTQLLAESRVVDLGCGCGVPMSRTLVECGHRVTGVDFSEVQIARARRLVPGAVFMCEDLTTVRFEQGSVDAVVCLYSIIHVPVVEHASLLRRVGSWLRPGGVLLLTAGVDAWTGSEAGWLGTDAPMWWSQADAASYRRWLFDGGFVIDEAVTVPDGDSAHALFWARRDG